MKDNKSLLEKDRKIIEELEATGERFKVIFQNAPIGISVWGSETLKCYEINDKTLEIFGRPKEEIIRESWVKFTHPDDVEENEIKLREMIAGAIDTFTLEKRFYRPDGSIVWVRLTNAFFGYSKDGDHLHICMMEDITEHKLAQEKLKDYSYRDILTGLGNRRCFEDRMREMDTDENLPLTLVMADVNGLKLTNDTFGHKAGDRLLVIIGHVMNETFKKYGEVMRIGGDEFVALLPSMDRQTGKALVEKARQEIGSRKIEGNIICSASIGIDTKTSGEQSMEEIFKSAEYKMYHNKLEESRKMREKTIKSITETLNNKNPREKEHCERVAHLCEGMGRAMSFTERDMQNLRTAALLHDIGKIGIARSILDKRHKLTGEEIKEVRKHPEIGYQLLRGATEFAPIAETVLSHHERIDGNGYPRRIKGEGIPLLAKMICIADAFDSMTEKRCGYGAFSEAEALEELERYAGTQFDEELVKLFIEDRRK